MNKYIENLYNVLFEFDFEGVKESTPMPLAILTLIVSSSFLFIARKSIKSGFGAETKYLFTITFYIICILIFWYVAALFFEYVAKIFSKSGKLNTLLTLTGFSFLPYIFVPCCELIKKFSDIGYFLGTKLEFLLFFWVIFIYAKALAKTYDLEKTSSYMLVFLPLISLFFAFIWLIGSAFNLGYIYSV